MLKKRFDRWIQDRDPREVLQILEPHLTPDRQARIDEVLDGRIHGLQVAVEQASNVHNAFAIVRTAEALGVTRMRLIDPQGKVKGGWGTTKGAMNWVDLRVEPNLDEFVAQQHLERRLIAGASLDGKLSLENLPVDKDLCVLFGNEQRGLTREAHEKCDLLFKIPMTGMSQSLNLSVSAGVVLYDQLLRRRDYLGAQSDLDSEQRLVEKAWYYAQSISPRFLLGLFPDIRRVVH